MRRSTRQAEATSRSVSPTQPRHARSRTHFVCSGANAVLYASLSSSLRAVDEHVKINAQAKIPKAADASKHKAGGGNVEICQSEAPDDAPHSHRCLRPLTSSLPALPSRHAVDQPVKIKAQAKIPKAADASKHKAGGGNVEICQRPTAARVDRIPSPASSHRRLLLPSPAQSTSRSRSGRRPKSRRPQTPPSTRPVEGTWRFVSALCHSPIVRTSLRHPLTIVRSLLPTTSSLITVDQPVRIVASPKIPTAADAAKHKAGGGNVEICQRLSPRSLPHRCPHGTAEV